MATSYIHWLYCKNLYESKMTGGNGYVNLVSFLCVFVARGTSIWLGTGTRNSYNATSSKGHQHNSQLTAFFVLQKTNTCRYLRLKFDFGSSQLCYISHGSQVLCSKSLKVNPHNLNRWEHGSWDLSLHTGSPVLRPNNDMNAYMATLFGGEAWNLCWELGWAKRYSKHNLQ